jgi:hypothetical protein
MEQLDAEPGPRTWTMNAGVHGAVAAVMMTVV